MHHLSTRYKLILEKGQKMFFGGWKMMNCWFHPCARNSEGHNASSLARFKSARSQILRVLIYAFGKQKKCWKLWISEDAVEPRIKAIPRKPARTQSKLGCLKFCAWRKPTILSMTDFLPVSHRELSDHLSEMKSVPGVLNGWKLWPLNIYLNWSVQPGRCSIACLWQLFMMTQYKNQWITAALPGIIRYGAIRPRNYIQIWKIGNACRQNKVWPSTWWLRKLNQPPWGSWFNFLLSSKLH